MHDFQRRVVDEKTELDNKIRKLTFFIDSEKFASVPEEERELMNEQLKCMRQYTSILTRRIEAFGK